MNKYGGNVILYDNGDLEYVCFTKAECMRVADYS